MIATGVITPFMVPMKVTALVAFLIALPYVLYQAWAFVAPGLYEHEKKLVLPLVVVEHGAVPARHRVLLLLRVRHGVHVHRTASRPRASPPRPDIEAYLSFVITMFLAFGVTFEIPVVVIVLVRSGMVTVEQLKRLPPLRDRRRLRGRRGRHAAGRALAAHARGADVPALRARDHHGENCRPRHEAGRRCRGETGRGGVDSLSVALKFASHGRPSVCESPGSPRVRRISTSTVCRGRGACPRISTDC